MLIQDQGCSLLGFAFAAMGRYFMVSISESGKTDLLVRAILIDNPEFIFPLSLQQVTLYRSMDTKNRSNQKRAQDQVKVCPCHS